MTPHGSPAEVARRSAVLALIALAALALAATSDAHGVLTFDDDRLLVRQGQVEVRA